MTCKNRKAITPILATVLIIASTIVLGGIVLVTSTDFIKTQLLNDSVNITTGKISNLDTESYLTLTIKNAGTSKLTDLIVTVTGFESGVNTEYDFNPQDLRPSKSGSLTEKLPEFIPEGKPILVIVSGNTTSGGTISETQTIRP